jgi:hypothetical protein
MQVLVNTCICEKNCNVAENEMYTTIEETPYIVDLMTPRNMKRNTVRVFCALLFAAALKCEFQALKLYMAV